MAARFATKTVTIYTNGNDSLHTEASSLFKSPKVTTDNRKIESYALKGDGPAMTITFEDGSSKDEGFCVNQPKMAQRGPFAEQLGLEMGEGGLDIKAVPPFFETSVKGCFAAGDAATPMKSVLQAMYMGGLGGAGMVMQLGAEADEKGEL
jgi:thioredoxin reductase